MTDTKFDPRALRDAFGTFMTGVTVVTTMAPDGNPIGFTANSFSSVSIDPPLLLVSIANTSRSHKAFMAAPGLAVNVLSEDQKSLSSTFARTTEDRFKDIFWKRGPIGSPILADVSAWFDCIMHDRIAAGDHTILLGRIGAFDAAPSPGLGYYRGAYVTPAAMAGQMPTGPDVIVSAILDTGGEVLLVDDGKGGLTLPEARVGREGMQAALAVLLARTGLKSAPGVVYAIYDDTARGTQHIAFLCAATRQPPTSGRFVGLGVENLAPVSDPAMRSMLERLASETRLGNYGVYFGTHEQGKVTPIKEK